MHPASPETTQTQTPANTPVRHDVSRGTSPVPNTDTINPATLKMLSKATRRRINALSPAEWGEVLAEVDVCIKASIAAMSAKLKPTYEHITEVVNAFVASRRYSVTVFMDGGLYCSNKTTMKQAQQDMRRVMAQRPGAYGSISAHPASSVGLAHAPYGMSLEYHVDERGFVVLM